MDKKVKELIQERGLAILSRHKGGFQFTDTFFPYTSGEIGPYFVQSGVVQNNGWDYQVAIKDMSELVKDAIGPHSEKFVNMVISGGETRDWIFSTPVAYVLGKPHVMLYKDGKTVGADMRDKEVAHVADLSNEGSSPRDLWVPVIKKAGGTINDIFFYVDRMEEGVQVMQDLGLSSHAAVPLDEHAWDYQQKKGVVTPAVYQNLMARGKSKEERESWARNMLRSDAGLARLVQLFDSPNDREKVRKILIKGYPDMKDELVQVLQERNKGCINIQQWLVGV